MHLPLIVGLLLGSITPLFADTANDAAWKDLGEKMSDLAKGCLRDSSCFATQTTPQFCNSMTSTCNPCGVVINKKATEAFHALEKRASQLPRDRYRECAMAKCVPAKCEVHCTGFTCVGSVIRE